MTVANRADFLAPDPRRYESISLPNGQTVRIRNLTELEKADFEASVLNDKADVSAAKLKKHRCRLIIACLVDDAGQVLLTEADLPALQGKDGAVTTLIADRSRKHCGFDAGDIEELAKNCVAVGD